MKYAIKRLFGEEFSTLLKINIISSILCMFIITIGPVIIAIKALFIEILDSRCPVDRVKEFFRLFKKNFLKGFLFELLLAAFIFMLLWAVSVNDSVGGSGILLVSIGISGFFGCLVSVTAATVLAGSDAKFFEALVQGVYMALGRFPFALMSAACVYGILFSVYLLYPISFVPLVILGITTASALSITFLWPTCRKFVLLKEGDDPDPTEDDSQMN